MRTPPTRRLWLVMKREFRITVTRRSFWLTTFLLPLALLLLNFSTQLIGDTETLSSPIPTAESEGPLAYVDESGLLRRLPPEVPAGALRAYPDESQAREALAAGEIVEYSVIPADYVESGSLSLVTQERKPLDGSDLSPLSGVSPLLIYALNYNLTDASPTARLLTSPIVQLVDEPASSATEDEADIGSLAYAVPYAALMILYLVLVMTGGYMLTSVAKEKENRTAEVLLVSLPARDLMLGKILGLTGVGLLQIAIWMGAGLVVLDRVRDALPDLGTYSLPPGFVPWTLAYFLLGFLLYASVYATLGVKARTAREASQMTYVALVPLIVPLIVSSTLIQEPQGALSLVLSLFPLTAPVAMVTRLAADSVPLWQAVLGLALVAGTAYATVLVAARFFRVENLLSSRAFSWRGLVEELAAVTKISRLTSKGA